ncbi:hypothetical protein BC940DRAFT_308373 [Gongronella butleri]|nr:hypothetical protein BC940DRAFT_308373 [Gongronella butleri]
MSRSSALTGMYQGAWVDAPAHQQQVLYPQEQEHAKANDPAATAAAVMAASAVVGNAGTSSNSGGDNDPSDHTMDRLRETIATLREQAKQLEKTDIVVKKSIQIVSQKRILAVHQRRSKSQWDWCEPHTLPDLAPSDADDDWSDWEWVDEEDDHEDTTAAKDGKPNSASSS